jgi:hypothetical protein
MPTEQLKPNNIFELINLNVFNLSQDVAALYKMIADIHSVLFTTGTAAEQGEETETI